VGMACGEAVYFGPGPCRRWSGVTVAEGARSWSRRAWFSIASSLMTAHLKRDLGNLVACTVDQLAATVKTLLKRIQYRPELIDGFLAQTGLSVEPEPP
jgi:hypothetical protein